MKTNKTMLIGEAFKNGEVLTVMGISRRWSVNCPYGIIRDLRRKGFDIVDSTVQNDSGTRYKKYYLETK